MSIVAAEVTNLLCIRLILAVLTSGVAKQTANDKQKLATKHPRERKDKGLETQNRDMCITAALSWIPYVLLLSMNQ